MCVLSQRDTPPAFSFVVSTSLELFLNLSAQEKDVIESKARHQRRGLYLVNFFAEDTVAVFINAAHRDRPQSIWS